jgi:hypothetical protein
LPDTPVLADYHRRHGRAAAVARKLAAHAERQWHRSQNAARQYVST